MREQREQADWIVLNARIWTGSGRQPPASALAVRGERILAVGDEREIRAFAGASTVSTDARGAFIAPGFIDSHLHFVQAGFRLQSVQLRDAASPAGFTRRIAEYAKSLPEGAWVVGGDWDHQNWGGQLPDRRWIDAVAPRNPVWVRRLDGHMGLASSLALEKAGLSADSAPIPGGEIVRDARGRLTGILKDNAMGVVDRAVPEPSAEMKDRALDAAMRHVASLGITSVHHMGSWDDLAVFERARRAGRLSTRIYAAVPLSSWERLKDYIAANGRGDAWLRTGMLKGFVDGSLGSRTAAMLAPFSDREGGDGLLVNTSEQLYQWIHAADRAGLQCAVHAIGDRANRLLLDIYERVARENGPRDRRFRIEHAQHLDLADIPRFAQLGVIASMQPYHLMDDGRWAPPMLGARRSATTYAFRSLLSGGARLAFGSDWYVAPPVVTEGVYAAVTRRTLDGRNPGGWTPGEKIGAEEALRAYTAGPAYAAFEEKPKGSIEPGKLADIVFLDRDPRETPPDELRGIRVLRTVVGGKTVFERQP